MEAIRSSLTSVHARFSQRHIPEDDILQSIYSSIEDSEVVLVFERNNAGLKELSSLSEGTSDSSSFLNVMCMYSTVNCIFYLSYFDPDYPTSALTVTGLDRVYSILKR
jgi:hypothetical protein